MTDKNIVKAAKTPDQLLKTLTTSFQWSRAHSQLVVGAVVVFFLVGGGVSLYDYLRKHKEIELQEKYYTLERIILDKKKEFAKANSKDSEKELPQNDAQEKQKQIKPPAKQPQNLLSLRIIKRLF
ncbi:MAG: hypothetical protein IPK04_20920 [Bdellovibrionales bacterium]|nr:hypothetical protein [Bdellovibrionales bacterium]